MAHTELQGLEYVVDCVSETVDYAMGRPSSSRGRSSSRQQYHTSFLNFVNNVLTKAEVKVPVVLVALVYIDRAKPHLQIALEQWACERVFLGALILANKVRAPHSGTIAQHAHTHLQYCNDSTLKNIHWALCTGVFGKRDVGRIEREFLDVLDYELTLHESDLLSHHDAIMSFVYPSRFAHRTHHTASAPASPRNHRRSHLALAPTASLPSRWSDSSDSDSDHSTSPSQSPVLLTPHMEIEPAYVPAISASPAELPHAAEPEAHHPAKARAADAGAHAHKRFGALNHLLRSFPIPHFHHSSGSSCASTSPLSATSTSSSSTAFSVVSAASIPRCSAAAYAPQQPATMVVA